MQNHEILAALKQKLLAGLAGDRTSYAEFLHEISPVLRRIIGKKIPDRDVEDVLQDVLISLHKARHTYDGTRPLMPWVMAITGYRITDHLRKAYHEMRHMRVDIAAYENVLEAVTETAGESESMHEILNGVGQRERKILTLMHAQGYTAREVGTQLGMKESAVKVAAHRAIRKIRQRFGNG